MRKERLEKRKPESHVIFRELQERDINLVKKWLQKPHVAEWFEHPDAWIEEIEQRKTKYSFIRHFIIEDDNKPIGFCQYYDFSMGGETWNGSVPSEGSWSIDYFIGEPEYLGKGYGKSIVIQLTKNIFACTDAHRVIVQPEPGNQRSRNTLLSAGYCFDKLNDLYVYERIWNNK